MEISVIVPCFNEEKYIFDCIESIVHNDFPLHKLEILVVDGGSTDKTLPILKELQTVHPQLKIINNLKQKTPFALNLGIVNATGTYVLVAGAHAIYPKGYLNRLFELIQMPGIDVVGGALDTQVKQQTPKTQAIKFVLSHRFGVGNAEFRIAGDTLKQVDTVPFGLYKKTIFERAGVYNEKLIRNHDIELSKRIAKHGFEIWLDPNIRVTYFAREIFGSLAQNNYANGFWNVRALFITKRFGALSLRHYIPLLFLLSLVVPLAISPIFYPPLALVSLFSLALYLLVILVVVVSNSKKVNPFYLFWAFVTLHFSYGWGSLMGILTSLKPNRL